MAAKYKDPYNGFRRRGFGRTASETEEMFRRMDEMQKRMRERINDRKLNGVTAEIHVESGRLNISKLRAGIPETTITMSILEARLLCGELLKLTNPKSKR